MKNSEHGQTCHECGEEKATTLCCKCKDPICDRDATFVNDSKGLVAYCHWCKPRNDDEDDD
jgi:hypothetical protein